MEFSNIKLRFLLFAAAQYMKLAAIRYPAFKERIKGKT
jgi:hypothetical protein